MDHKRNTIQGIKWTSIDKWSRELINFIVIILLARMLDPAVFGLVALGKIFISFVEQFYKMGLEAALIQREKLEDEHKNAAFWFNVVVALLIIIITVSTSSYVARFFDEPKLKPIVIFLAVSIIAQSLSIVHRGISKREFKFSILAKRNIASTIISSIVGLSMAIAGFGAWSLVGLYTTSNFVGMILLWSAIRWRPKTEFSYKHFQDLFSFSVYIFFSGITKSISKQSDKILIGKYLSIELVGIYKIAQTIVRNVNSLLSAALSNVALPVLSRLQNDDRRLLYSYYINVRLSLLFTAPLLVILISFPELILEKVFGEQWMSGAGVLKIIAIFGILESISFFNVSIMYAKGYSNYYFYFTMFSTILNIGFIILLIPFGIEGVAIAVLISGIISHIAFILLVKRIMNLKIMNYLYNIIIGLFPAIIMYLGIEGIMFVEIDMWHNIQVAISVLIGLSLYALAINLFDRVLVGKILNEIKKVM